MAEPKLVKYTADSGVELHVQPLSPFTFRAIRQKAFEKFPDPDEGPYRLPIPNAAIEGDTMPAKDNPAYARAVHEQAARRSDYITVALLALACDPTPNKDELVKQFEDQLLALQRWAALPEDDWEAALLHCILIGKDDPGHISDIANQNAPLTEVEIENGIRFFRFKHEIPGQDIGQLVRPASGVQ